MKLRSNIEKRELRRKRNERSCLQQLHRLLILCFLYAAHRIFFIVSNIGVLFGVLLKSRPHCPVYPECANDIRQNAR